MKTRRPTFDVQKMEQVILYFLERINNIHLGRVKLMKLLYYVDFDHFEKHGASVTQARYRKLPHGPVPDEAEGVIAAMCANGLIEEFKHTVGLHVQDRLITRSATFEPVHFSATEFRILEAVASRWEDAPANEIEKASHDEAPWASSKANKAISYDLAEYRTPLKDEEELDEALAMSPEFQRILDSIS